MASDENSASRKPMNGKTDSTYIQHPPFFDDMKPEPIKFTDIKMRVY